MAQIKQIIESCKSQNWLNYQSIFWKGETLFKGGRDEELIKRFNFIRLEDIKDKIVVDIGCNIGSSCLLAVENGAKKAYGFDIEPGLIKTAQEIANELKANCEYIVADYGKLQEKVGDTIFCFAVDSYLDTEILAQNLKQYDVVYFETHGNRTNAPAYDIPDEIKREFLKQQYLGMVGTNNKRTFRLTK
jgi:predicted RNA methylase